MNKILCFSGGLDSLAAYYFLGKPKTVYFDYGGYCDKEIAVVKKLVPETIIDKSLDLYRDSSGESNYIPYRNLLFALRAAKYGNEIIIAGISGDDVSDKSPHAFQVMSIAMNQLDSTFVTVDSPFWHHTKEDIVKILLDLPNGEELIKASTSCYHPTQLYCGQCQSCFRKACALFHFGIHLGWDNKSMLLNYLRKAKTGYYTPERNESIIKFAENYLHKGKLQ